MMENEIVWEIPKITQLITGDTTITVPEYVTSFNLCGCAAGGGGSATDGGSAGQMYSNVSFPVIPGEQIIVVIGQGGAVGESGGDSSFGTLDLSGGTSGNYQGIGNERVTCGGRHYDGIGASGGYGGQASTHGNGGDPNEAGTKGSGGGANSSGGNGMFQFTYFFEDR